MKGLNQVIRLGEYSITQNDAMSIRIVRYFVDHRDNLASEQVVLTSEQEEKLSDFLRTLSGLE